MNARIAALLGALSLVLTACPGPSGGDDAGTDAGIDASIPEPGGCTGGCGPGRKCDEAQRKCVDMCNDACGAGLLCLQNAEGNWTCDLPVTSCNGVTCNAGQAACIDNTCSCRPFTEAAVDTCAVEGRICRASWNPGLESGGACSNPELYERCIPASDCPEGQQCATCGTGRTCAEVFLGEGAGICVRSCGGITGGECGVDELCAQGLGCLPRSVFGAGETGSFACQQAVPLSDGGYDLTEDGGFRLIPVPVTHPCLMLTDQGTAAEDPSTPSGTCAQILLRDKNAQYPISYCRTNGAVPEFGACKTTPIPTSLEEVCAAGLECVSTGNGDTGMCMRMCNAVPGSGGGQCGENQGCVNLYGLVSDNAVLGACMTHCNVFSNAPNHGCSNYGSTATACVPTTAESSEQVSPNGEGICVPVNAATAAEGEACTGNDALDGAACESGLVCARLGGGNTQTCVRPCDLACAGDNPPERCTNEANATCGGGKTCTQVSGRTGATLGFCL